MDDGTICWGHWDLNGHLEGLGGLRTPNGDVFEGDLKMSLPNGEGRLQMADGAWYEGEFQNGWFHGSGIYRCTDGTAYIGQFCGGNIKGRGVLRIPSCEDSHERHLEGIFSDGRLLSTNQGDEEDDPESCGLSDEEEAANKGVDQKEVQDGDVEDGEGNQEQPLENLPQESHPEQAQLQTAQEDNTEDQKNVSQTIHRPI